MRRVAGALACHARVDVLVAGGAKDMETTDGALSVRRFSDTPVDPIRRALIWRVSLGGRPDDLAFCTCVEMLAAPAATSLPRLLREELIRAQGGDSPDLFAYLATERYDVVIFAGYSTATTYFGLHTIGDRPRLVLLPLLRDELTWRSGLFDSVFDRVERILVITDAEEQLIYRRLGYGLRDRVEGIGFALRVSRLAAETEPVGEKRRRHLVFGRNWKLPCSTPIMNVAARIATDLPDVRVLLVGKGSHLLAKPPWVEVRQTSARADVWRWMARALAVFDPEPHKLLAREVLEGMLYGTPALVTDHAGVAREHVVKGNGGICFRSYSHLREAIKALLDPSLRATLGAQGRDYATREYGDPEAFTERVRRAVLED